MTDADALRHIATCDLTALAEAFRPLSEKERRALRPAVKRFYRQIREHQWSIPWGRTVFAGEYATYRECYSAQPKPSKHLLYDAAQLGMLAVETPAIGTQIGVVGRHRNASWDLAAPWLSVLAGRGKPWVQKWSAKAIDAELLDWFSVRKLVGEGLCDEPESDAYLVSFGRDLCVAPFPLTDGGRVFGSASDYLRGNPELMPLVYRLFELDCPAFLNGGDPHELAYGRETWEFTMRVLVEEGLIDRERVIDRCLKKLAGEMAFGQDQGIPALLESINLADEELAARQRQLNALLAAPASRAVAFALKMARRLEKVGALDAQAFMETVGPAFQNPNKGPCADLLRLMKRVGDRVPESRAAGVGALVEYALFHPNSDIATGAVEHLITWREAISKSTSGELRALAEDLPAPARLGLRELLGDGADSRQNGAAEADLDRLRARAAALPPRFRALAGVDGALAATEAGAMPASLHFDILEVPVSTGCAPVAPIGSADELLDFVSENEWGGMNFERILDGVSRLGFERTGDFDRRAAPLLKRLAGAGVFGTLMPTHYAFSRLLHRWLSGELRRRATLRHTLRGAAGRMVRALFGRSGPTARGGRGTERIEALSIQLAEGVALPVLAMPTHEGGWVSGLALVERWAAYEAANRTPAACDVEQALWRLMPDARAEALERAGGLTHRWAPAIRWALGSGGETVPSCAGDDRRIWMAAAHARCPGKHFDNLVGLRAFAQGESHVPDTQYTWRAPAIEPAKDADRSWISRAAARKRLDLSVKPPNAFRYRPWWEGIWANDIAQAALRFPLNRDVLFANSVYQLLEALDVRSAALPELTDLLLNPDEPCTGNAALALVVAMVSANAETRGAAVDAAIACIQDGRLDAEQLAAVVVLVGLRPWSKLNRLCECLAEVARVSPLHAYGTAVAMERLAAGYEAAPRDIHHVLTLLLDLQAGLGLGPPDEAGDVLVTLTGASKAAKLARQLRHLEPSSDDPLRAVRLAMLEARITRAARWAGQERD